MKKQIATAILAALSSLTVQTFVRADEAAPVVRPATKDLLITDFGAVGDGKTKNTEAFAKAIDACAAAGGGRVVVPAGEFLTGPIVFKTGVELHLERDSKIQFSRDIDDYPIGLSDYEGRKTVQAQSPITGRDLTDIAITGWGVIDGGGDAWRSVKKSKLTPEQWDTLVKSGGVVLLDKDRKKDPKKEEEEAAPAVQSSDPNSQEQPKKDDATWYPSVSSRDMSDEFRKTREEEVKPGAPAPKVEDYKKYRELLRPEMVLFINCKNLRLEGATFRNTPNWNVHLQESENITVRGVTIFNEAWAQNGDGIDFDSCKDVVMTNCNVNAGDDAICLKSGRDEEGRKRGKATENVTISNCTVGTGHGGVVIGSEMSGGVRNVSVTNCIFKGTDAGLRFKTTRGRGGVVENISVDNVQMYKIGGPAILFDMYYMVKKPTTEPVTERTPIFRQFHIRNITCHGAKKAIEVRGLPELPIEGITLENVRIDATAGASFTYGQNIILRDVHVHATSAPAVDIQNVSQLTTERLEAIADRVGPATKPAKPTKPKAVSKEPATKPADDAQ